MDPIKEYAFNQKKTLFKTLKELCHIPAPSHLEQRRAEYCKNWLIEAGAKGVYIDNACNVIFPLNCERSKAITVFAAHTDTVFPDTEPMPYFDDGRRIHCPGAADDTASVAVLLLMAKYFIDHEIVPKNGIMFVCNSCEEGLGNLQGTRQLFQDYHGRIARFIAFDSSMDVVCDHCVGSCRYEVEVHTNGGHSFYKFGNKNAIAELARMIDEIYQLEIPEKQGTKTTYNVGTICGGTSVNTIAHNAKMLCEYRSDNKECLAIMQAQFERIFLLPRAEHVRVSFKKVGERPCEDIDPQNVEDLKQVAFPVIEAVLGQKVSFASGSTDCNIPLSLGIPALCVGVNQYSGIHTREEWVDKDSVVCGLEIAIRLGIAMAEYRM